MYIAVHSVSAMGPVVPSEKLNLQHYDNVSMSSVASREFYVIIRDANFHCYCHIKRARRS